CRRGRARPCGRVTARCGPGPRPGDSAAARRPGRGLRGCPRGGEARARAGAAGRGELTLDLVARAGDEVAQVLDGCADKVPDSLRCEYTPENTEISGVQSHLSDVRDTVPMRIGEVSQCSGVSVRMLRHYDSLGLVRPSGRTSAGYREYADEDLRRSLHLEALRSLGLSLAQAGRALNGGEESDDTTTSDPAAVLDALIARTRERLDAEHELLTLLADTRDRAPRDRDEVLATIALLRAVHSDDPGTGPHPRDRPDRTTRDGRLVRAPRPRSPGRHQWSDRTRTRPGGDRVDAAAAHARMFDALDQLSPILDPLADLFAQRGFELALVGGS